MFQFFFRSEKNATDWSKNKIRSLITNLEVDEPGLGKCVIHEVESIEGEAFVNNRKAKLIFFYEWNIKAKWKGNLNGEPADKEVEGEIEIPNLSEENGSEEVEVQVTVKKGSGTVIGDALKELLRNKGTTLLQNQLAKYISELRDDFAKDLILPTKDSKANQSNSSINVNVKHVGKSQVKSNVTGNVNNTTSDCIEKDPGDSLKTLKLTDSMKCRADELFNVLTMPELVSAFSRSQAISEAKEGGSFSMFGGNITGTFISLQVPNSIKQKWRFTNWPKDHYSDVSITLEQKSEDTSITVNQTGIPSNDYERTENGWKNYYFESIKRTFGFGATLY